MPWPCGLADFVDRLAEHLHAAGVSVTVLTSHPQADRGRLYRVEVMPGSWGYRHRRRMVGWIREQGYNIVDLQYEAFAFGRRGAPLWLPLQLLHPRPARVLTLHSQILPRWGGRLWRLLQMKPYEAIVFYSEVFLTRMAARFPSRAERYYHQSFPSNIPVMAAPQLRSLVARIRAGWPHPDLIVLYFGHIAPRRGLEDLITAGQNLAHRGFRPHFVLVSQFDPAADDYHRQLLYRIAAAGLSERFSFPGRLPPEQVSYWFHAADVVVLPFPDGASFKNGTLAAALVHGAAIVTTISDISEPVLRSNDVVAGYQAGDVSALTDRLAELLTDPQRRDGLKKAAAKLGKTLSWEHYVRRRIEIYHHALERRL
ncbi:MAG: glycosyltransferase family 4 protein [Thermogemmata sp.]|nr:glycosyltransferase family 4 protein [Thermogemmata sp.]